MSENELITTMNKIRAMEWRHSKWIKDEEAEYVEFIQFSHGRLYHTTWGSESLCFIPNPALEVNDG